MTYSGSILVDSRDAEPLVPIPIIGIASELAKPKYEYEVIFILSGVFDESMVAHFARGQAHKNGGRRRVVASGMWATSSAESIIGLGPE